MIPRDEDAKNQHNTGIVQDWAHLTGCGRGWRRGSSTCSPILAAALCTRGCSAVFLSLALSTTFSISITLRPLKPLPQDSSKSTTPSNLPAGQQKCWEWSPSAVCRKGSTKWGRPHRGQQKNMDNSTPQSDECGLSSPRVPQSQLGSAYDSTSARDINRKCE